jgi:hypothetical protein
VRQAGKQSRVVFSIRRDHQDDQDRPWKWKDQESLFADLLARIEWARGLGARVDLRALATRADPNATFTFAYVHAHVRPFDGEERTDDALSFRYPTAWFEREVVSIEEFLVRVNAARLDQTARLRSTEREQGSLRVGQLEAALQTDGDTRGLSSAGYSRRAVLPSWSWWVGLVSPQPTTPLVSYSSGAPFFETRLDLIEDFGGMRWFSTDESRVRALNVVVSDPRGVIDGIAPGKLPNTVVLNSSGQRLHELRVSARWRGRQSTGTYSTTAAAEIELPEMQGPLRLNVALVAEHDELVDIASFQLVPAPAMHEIREMIRRGETARVEFKEWIRLDDQKMHKLERCVVAMANGSEVGVILVGVADTGELKWADFLYKWIADRESIPSQFERRCVAVQQYGMALRDELLTKIAPGPVIDVEAIGLEQDVVLRMSVEPSRVWVHDREDRIWIRRNASVRPPTNEELDAKRGPR